MKAKIIFSIIANFGLTLLFAYGQIQSPLQPVNAQNWSSEKKLSLYFGDYLLAPTKSNNFYGFIQYNHSFSFGDGVKTPRIGLLLNPMVTLGGGLKKNVAPFNTFKPLQWGRVSLVPTLTVSNYVDNDANKDVELFALVRVGINYYPLIKGTGSSGLNGYEQWQVGVGGGINFRKLVRVEATYYRAGYDLNKNTRQYFEENISPSAFFNAVDVIAKFKIFQNLSGLIDWHGFANSYDNEKYLAIGLNYDIPFVKTKKGSQSTPPENKFQPTGKGTATSSENKPKVGSDNGKSPSPSAKQPTGSNSQKNGTIKGEISTFEKAKNTELELSEVLHYNGKKGDPIELSGLAIYGKKIYMVLDNKKDIFEIQWIDGGFQTSKTITTQGLATTSTSNFNFEGIDVYNNTFYIINEDSKSTVYQFGMDGKKLYDKSYSKEISFKNNDGLEGIAIDPASKKLYLAKERGPALIIKTNIDSASVASNFFKPIDKNEDFSDLKYNSGYLYVLQRRKHRILKLDSNGNPVSQVSFESTTTNSSGSIKQMYEVPPALKDFGLAEALLITKDKIYVGMDPNNNSRLSPWFIQKYGIKGAKADGHPTVILAFKRPAAF